MVKVEQEGRELSYRALMSGSSLTTKESILGHQRHRKRFWGCFWVVCFWGGLVLGGLFWVVWFSGGRGGTWGLVCFFVLFFFFTVLCQKE